MDIIDEAMQALKFHETKVAEYKAFLRTAEILAKEMLANKGKEVAQDRAPLIKPRLKHKNSAKQRIISTTKKILSDTAQMSTRDLMEELSKNGVEVGGKNKIINLSSVLGRSGMFANDRKTGWSLK